MRFVLTWRDQDRARNITRVADAVGEAADGVRALLAGEQSWNEEYTGDVYEDGLVDAVVALLDLTGDDTVEALLCGMRPGDEETLTCESGEFTITRER
jgi:hypothetical protein